MRTRRRVDDATAIADWLFAHGTLALAIALILASLAVPALRAAIRGASVIGLVAAARLYFHPLRFVAISRVWIDGGRVSVAPLIGRARDVQVVKLEHDGHSPWPCVLHLEGGELVRFVARRDDGSGAMFDLEPSDRARYERPSEARDSLTDIEVVVRRA